jgi:hypothetical protein
VVEERLELCSLDRAQRHPLKSTEANRAEVTPTPPQHRDDLGATNPVESWAALLPPMDPTTMGWFKRDWYLGVSCPTRSVPVGCRQSIKTSTIIVHGLVPSSH